MELVGRSIMDFVKRITEAYNKSCSKFAWNSFSKAKYNIIKYEVMEKWHKSSIRKFINGPDDRPYKVMKYNKSKEWGISWIVRCLYVWSIILNIKER
jgi:hypothetical protein